MKEDEDKVDLGLCVQCGLCEKVCPMLNLNVERKPKRIYAAKNNNLKIREESSSEGYLLCWLNRL